MPTIEHPDRPGEHIDVEIVDHESHRGVDVVQIQAVEDGVELTDDSGNAPWVPVEAIEDGLVKTPEGAVALAEGRTPEEAEAVREEVEE